VFHVDLDSSSWSVRSQLPALSSRNSINAGNCWYPSEWDMLNDPDVIPVVAADGRLDHAEFCQ
jgi:hypothetical protein